MATLSTNSCLVTWLSSCRLSDVSLAQDPNSDPDSGSTMRFCGTFARSRRARSPERAGADGRHAAPSASAPPSSRSTTQTAVRHSNPASRSASTASSRGAAGGDDVLDEADPLALLEHALEPVRGAVLLRLLAHDQERQAGRERRRRGERDRAELGPGEARRVGLVLATASRDPLAERAEQLGPRLEAVLVEVVARAAARAQDEVALEVRVLAERRGERRRRSRPRCGRERRRGRARAGARRRASPSQRDHRAVVEVDVDPLAPPGARGGGRARRPSTMPRRAGCRQELRRASPSRRLLRPCGLGFGSAFSSVSAAAAFGFAASPPARLLVAARGAQSALQVVEDEPDRRARGASSRRSRGRRRGRRRRCPSPVAASSCVTRRGAGRRAHRAEQRDAARAKRVRAPPRRRGRADAPRRVAVEEHGGLDLRRDLGQVGECLLRRPSQRPPTLPQRDTPRRATSQRAVRRSSSRTAARTSRR